ncbi:MAG TPA: pitrilysin family protein [Terriglobia bacterium]|nr:pitrilysin family protein [Terriglobia bacterium]
MASALFVALCAAGVTAPRASDRTLPPSVPPPQPIALPTPDVRTLANGLQVLVVERHSLPVLTLRLLVRAGAESDPAGLPGIAQFTAGLLNEGTEHRSAIELAEAIDSAGGTVDSSVGWDSSFLVLTVLADHAPLAFDLMADMAVHPAFYPAEVERGRRQTLSALDVLHNDPSYLADTVMHQVLLAGTPYGHPADGTVDSVKRARPEDLAAFHAREFVPSRSVLAVVGDIAPASALELAARYFGGWRAAPAAAPSGPKAALSPPAVAPPQANPSPSVVIVDKPDAVQTEIRVANAGIPRSSPDYVALTVANQILGGPASNRLFSDLRGEHGLTYGASSDLDCYLVAGTWEAKTSTRTPETAKTVHRVLDQMKRLRDRPISAQELQQAVDYLIGHQALDFETSDGIADQFLDLMADHLPLDTWSAFPAALRRLTPDEVWQATRRHLDPDQATVVLVGNAVEFEKDMRKLGPTRVIPIDRLDLGSSTLVR